MKYGIISMIDAEKNRLEDEPSDASLREVGILAGAAADILNLDHGYKRGLIVKAAARLVQWLELDLKENR